MHFVEIEFRGRRRVTYVNPQQYPLSPNDAVIVQADRGVDLGYVNLTDERFTELNQANIEEGLEPEAVLRLAKPDDLNQLAENIEFEKDARGFFREEVKRIELEMKLVEIECQLDRRKLTFYFTADGRVDFRELVKSLAQKFHTRIDLRQIGARDESKKLGGIGICGRELCCSSWIREFKPVTTSMMKDQHMILNPQKNTGPCGKLRCCLRFEVDQYRELNQLFPKVGMQVKGPRGRGKITKFSYNWEHIGIEWEDGAKYSYGIEHLTECSDWKPEDSSKIQSLTFTKDPSLEQQRKDEHEGELMARATPQESGEPRVSVRSTPKKGHKGGKGKEPNCARAKDKPARGKHGGGPKGQVVTLEPVSSPSKSDSDSQDEKSGQRKSRRGGSRRRGRGRGDKSNNAEAQGAKRDNKQRSNKPKKNKKPSGDQQQAQGSKDSDGGEGKAQKPNRRRGGRGRNRSGGGGNKNPQGGNAGNAPKQSSGEAQSRPSGGTDQKPDASSQPKSDKPVGRPPKPRGRNRRR